MCIRPSDSKVWSCLGDSDSKLEVRSVDTMRQHACLEISSMDAEGIPGNRIDRGLHSGQAWVHRDAAAS